MAKAAAKGQKTSFERQQTRNSEGWRVVKQPELEFKVQRMPVDIED
jgi:hypothetical protein